MIIDSINSNLKVEYYRSIVDLHRLSFSQIDQFHE